MVTFASHEKEMCVWFKENWVSAAFIYFSVYIHPLVLILASRFFWLCYRWRIDTVNTLQSIRLISTTELRGIFSVNEWMFLADSFNGTIINDSIRYNVKMLIAHCEDSVIYDSLDKKYDVDMEVFKKKLSSLHCANVDALYARIEDFWDKDIDIEDWAKF